MQNAPCILNSGTHCVQCTQKKGVPCLSEKQVSSYSVFFPKMIWLKMIQMLHPVNMALLLQVTLILFFFLFFLEIHVLLFIDYIPHAVHFIPMIHLFHD